MVYADPDPDPDDAAVDALMAVAASDGVRALLVRLNERVAHRYTAIYRLNGEMLRCVHLIDKTGAVQPGFLAEVSLQDSFCQFVFRDGVFQTENSAFDHRLDGHPYQGVVVSYHAIPVVTEGSTLFGTLCHLDTVPCDLPDRELEILRGVAAGLPAFLERPAA
ncbi:guanylate cyclase [Variovorax sp. UMC13]|uniref:guanylate cyclase n=1 Tax=Variovorax sp. UMC13 TaxID=1862326 RepID=UPI0016011481|nr:guanylate cyclase [Variovorax sp. UMC13]MBB1602833.1 hypothetical protein [Variovorax sp. UMC13]